VIKVTDRIWVGNSDDEMSTHVTQLRIGAIINVAHDLQGFRGCNYGIEYAQVGLIDGPGNIQAMYCASILTLHGMLDRHPQVMIYCHDGGRALAVVLMYLILRRGKTSSHPTFFNYWTSWDRMIEEIDSFVAPMTLPSINESHKKAFEELPLSLLEMFT
jgi:hypothetical protein